MGNRRLAVVVIAVLLAGLAVSILTRPLPEQLDSPLPTETEQIQTDAPLASSQKELPEPHFALFTASSTSSSDSTTIDKRPVELLLQDRQALLADPYGSYPMETIVQLAEAGDLKAMNRATEWLSSPRTGSDEQFVDVVLAHTASSKDTFKLVRAGIQARETRPEIAGGLLLLALDRGYEVEPGDDFQARQSGFEDFVYQRLNALDDPSRAYARMDEFKTKLSIIEGGEEDAH